MGAAAFSIDVSNPISSLISIGQEIIKAVEGYRTTMDPDIRRGWDLIGLQIAVDGYYGLRDQLVKTGHLQAVPRPLPLPSTLPAQPVVVTPVVLPKPPGGN